MRKMSSFTVALSVGGMPTVTAATSDEEIDQLNDVLGELAERFEMQRQPTSS